MRLYWNAVSLCESCTHLKEIKSAKGSRFLFCEKSRTDKRFHKYPPQPVMRCIAYENRAKRPS